MQPDELVYVALSEAERYLLNRGLLEWGGPASCTEQMAAALGFKSVADLRDEGYRIATDLRNDRPLTRRDWTRALLSTEVVFASDVLGSGHDWKSTTGLDDVTTLLTLRGIQSRLAGEIIHPR